MGQNVFICLSQITQVHKKDVFLDDIAGVYCSDEATLNRVKALKIRTIKSHEARRYMGNVLDVIKKIEELDPFLSVSSVGETDFIISYVPPKAPVYAWEWTKTGAACLICFFGAMFAIMTFNNDANVKDVFREIYTLVMLRETDW